MSKNAQLKISMVKAILCGLLVLCVLFASGCQQNAQTQITITIPNSPYIRSIDANYYKLWLEEQTGFSITFNVIPESYTALYSPLIWKRCLRRAM